MIHRRSLTLNLAAPWLSRGNLVGLFGVDAPLARLPDGDLYLPGTLIIGRLAEAMRHFADVADQVHESSPWHGYLKDIFAHDGVGDDATRTTRQGRRRLFVSDLVCRTDEANPGETRTRVAIDALLGSATEGALQVIEEPFAPGSVVQFVGELRLLHAGDDADTILGHVAKALAWITQCGADRTVGFGVSLGSALCDPVVLPRLTPEVAAPRLRLRFRFHDLLCVGDLRTSGNTYMSSAVIPGGAIKGALVNQILAGKAGSLQDADCAGTPYEPLKNSFSKLRIGHAFPIPHKAAAPDRPRRVPASWVSRGAGFADWAMLRDPKEAGLIDDDAPKFAADWKAETALAGRLAGWSEPAVDLRLRTQISPDTRSAMANRLFAIGYRRCDTHDWIADVDFGGPDKDRETVFAALQEALRDGLVGVGRGGAFATVEVSVPPPATPPGVGRVIMTLQTPALLRCPAPAIAGDVTDEYAVAFRTLGVTATLKAVFVREQMRGAAFMAQRRGESAYRPWLLTEPGSVFVFDGVSGADQAVLSGWQAQGLAVPDATLESYGLKVGAEDNWRSCPYLPENGYGEVAFGPTAGVGAPEVKSLCGVIA